MSEINDILEKLKGIDIKADYTPFNMLHILYQEVYRKQEKIHDKFLAGLLNPNENHDFGDLLLKEFLTLIEIENDVIVNITNIQVEMNRMVRDLDSTDRFIDIFISWTDEYNKKCAVIIENKLHDAIDQPDQLNDYYSRINNENFDVKKVVYIPFSAKNRSVKNYPNLSSDVKNIAIDFDAKNIVEWITKCIEVIKEKKQDVSLLEQYKVFFECLINENFIKMKAEEILEAIGSNNIKEISRLESLARVINSKEWIKARFSKITAFLKSEFRDLQEQYLNGENARVQYWFEPYEVFVEVWIKEDCLWLYIVSKSKKEYILIANQKYTYDEPFDKYYYCYNDDYKYTDIEKLKMDLIPVLQGLSNYNRVDRPAGFPAGRASHTTVRTGHVYGGSLRCGAIDTKSEDIDW